MELAAYLGNLGRALLGVSSDESEERNGSIEDPNTPINADTIDNESGWGVLSSAGERTTPKRMLTIPAIYQAVSMISGDVAKIPLAAFRRLDTGGREMDASHHGHKHANLNYMANPETNAFKLWRRLMVSALLWNNGYLWIDRNARGEVLGLYNLLPDRTTPCRIDGKRYYLTEIGTGGTVIQLPEDEVFHLEGLSYDCFSGYQPLHAFRELVGEALAKRRFRSKFFTNGLTAGGFLMVPRGKSKVSVDRIRSTIKSKYSAAKNAFKTMVLRDGYKWVSTQIDPQKSQMLEATEQDAREIARYFNLRASRLSVSDSSSYNHDEMARKDYHDETLSHWLIASKCEANAKLRTKDERENDRLFFDYKINALLWADAKTRNEIAVSAIQHGRYSPNETREWENYNPYDGGDTYYRPLNLDAVDGSYTSSDSGGANERQRKAAARLAETTLERAVKRATQRWQRQKSLEDDIATLTEMVEPACEVLGRSVSEVLNFVITEAKKNDTQSA